MRLATITLATLGLMVVGTTFALARERLANAPAAPYVTTVADQVVATPVRWYGYRPVPAYRYPGYYAYRPGYYWSGPPRYYDYYVAPYPGYPGYYYPNGFGFQFQGPRRAFSFAF
jgi:hypothetical protein